MSPLNRGPLLGPRLPPVGIRPPPPPRFGGRLPLPGGNLPIPPRMLPPPTILAFGPMRQRLPPPLRPGGMSRPTGPLPLFPPRGRGMAPLVPMGLRAPGPRGPLMRPWPRRVLPPQMPHMRPRFTMGNGNAKGKAANNIKKVNKLEELELKKPWMTDEIRSEIQKKNKLYAKAKKNKDAKEWEEFKDLRNKVTRLIRDAKNDYLAKHPEQAHLYPDDQQPYDQRDENYITSDEDTSHYCEVCDRDFPTEAKLSEHQSQHKLCGIDGCTFSANPMLIERHISMQHSSGLYQRMKNVSTPEDIQKWLMERKKRYPTKANIELQKVEELVKAERGEIIKQRPTSMSWKSKKFEKSQSRKRKAHRRSTQTFNYVIPKMELYRGLHPFSGTMYLRESNMDDDNVPNEVKSSISKEAYVPHISDEEEDIVATTCQQTVSSPRVTSLVANYGSDSEDSCTDDEPEEQPIKRIKDIDDQNSGVAISETVSSGVTKDLEMNNSVKLTHNVNRDAVENTKLKSFNKQNVKSLQRISEKNDIKPMNKKYPQRLQLLQKLLSRSIQHERNLICQCIKYIVDNNFFE